jgi:hypothetical protein
MKGWLDNYGEEKNYNDSKTFAPKGFKGDGYSNVGRNYSPAWGGQFQKGGKLKFLQPTDKNLPEGYRIPYDTPSSERAMSIGGENEEPAYLIPSFKYGKELDDPMGEFRKTGEHLGGPFKTWQEADEWERTVRHPAVEKGENIMFPQQEFRTGGEIPKAQEGHLQTINPRQKRGIELLNEESKKAAEDKRELETTGQIKKPRSIAYRSKVKKQPELKQDNKNDYERGYDERKAKLKKFNKVAVGAADVATDIMQVGNFIPHPAAQLVGKIGNVAGAAVDAYQAGMDLSEGNYGSAAFNLGSATLPSFIEGAGYTRNMYNTTPGSMADKIASLGNRSGSYIPLTTLQRAISPATIKGVNYNRALLGALSGETAYDITNPLAASSEPSLLPPSLLETAPPPIPSRISSDKPIQYYNTNPKYGKVEKPGESSNVKYVPISNSQELKKWKKQKTEPLDLPEPAGPVTFPLPSPSAPTEFAMGGNIPKAQEGINNIFGNMMGGKNTSQYEMYGDDLAKGREINTFNPHYTRIDEKEPAATTEPPTEDKVEPYTNNASNNIGFTYQYPVPATSSNRRLPVGSFPTLRKRKKYTYEIGDIYNITPEEIEPEEEPEPEFTDPISWIIEKITNLFTPSDKTESETESETDTEGEGGEKGSWNIQQKNTRMKGRGGSYDALNIDTNNPKTIREAKRKADIFNSSIKKKYGNSKNPKAIERANTIRNDVQITPNIPTPNFAMGGSIPGAVGFSYVRTKGIPSNGPYAKKTLASAQNGVDMYENPMLARRVDNPNVNRSYYDPRLNTMNIGTDYDAWKDEYTGEQLTGDDLKYHQDKLLAHENYHAIQHSQDRDNYDIAHDTDNAQWAQMQKRPEVMSTDAVWNNFYNRSDSENQQDYQEMINSYPESRILNQNLLFDKVLDRQRYDNPANLEGEAKFYEDTGVDISKQQSEISLNPIRFQNGGEMRYYQHGLDWKPKGMENGGWLSKYDEAQKGKKIEPRDERKTATVVQDNVKPLSLREKRGHQLLIKETNDAEKDKKELQTTGQIKTPRSIHYRRLAPKQSQLTTQTKSDEELEGQLGLERPLIYLASPEKLLGDVGVPGMETSELDRQAVMANRFNPNQSRLDRFVNNAKIGLGYVPEATVNTAMAAAFMPEGSGALGLMNEAINPLAGLSTSIAPELRQGLRTAGPSFGSSVDNVTPTFKSEIDWSKWNKEIPENTQLMDEYSAIEQQAKADGTWMKYEKKVLDEEKTLNNKTLFDEQEKEFNLKNAQEEEVRKSLYAKEKSAIEIEEKNKLLDSKFKDYFDNASAQWKKNFETDPETKLEFLDIKGVNSKEIDDALESLSSNVKNREVDLLTKYEGAPINKFDRPNESVYTTSVEDFPGTPEQFVQSNSENFKKAYPEGWETVWRGGDKKPELNTKYINNGEVIFTTKDEYGANIYNRSDNPEVKLSNTETPPEGLTKLYAPKTENKIIIDGDDSYMYDGRRISGDRYRTNYARLDAINQTPSTLLQQENLNTFQKWMRNKYPEVDLTDRTMTDHFASFLNSPEGRNIDRVEFKKIFDGTIDPIDVEVHNLNNQKQLKSMFGNNGMFDMTNPNIYKSILPFVGYTGAGALTYKTLQGQEETPEYKQGGVIKDDMGQWAHPGEITEIGSNNITMQGVPYDVLGISDTGDTKLMKPGKNYKFKGKKVTEYPMAKNGMRQEQKGLVNLDQLTNFTNYNKPQPGGWLNKYN